MPVDPEITKSKSGDSYLIGRSRGVSYQSEGDGKKERGQ